MAISGRDSGDFDSEVRRAMKMNWKVMDFVKIAAGIAVLILLLMSIAYVPAGHVGVLTFFGRVTGDVLSEGTHFVNPFKVNNTFSVRTIEMKETASVPSDEGLIMTLDTSLLFRLDASKASEVFRTIGPEYVTTVCLLYTSDAADE